MFEDIKSEDVASFITAASAAKKAGKKKFSIGGKSYPVTIGKALEQRVAEMSEEDIAELSAGIGKLMKGGKLPTGLSKTSDKKASKIKGDISAMKSRLKKEDTGISIARKMMQITSMRHLAETIAEMEIITPDELQSIVSEDLKIAARSLFLEDIVEASEEGKVRIIKTKDNTFQVQRMTKGEFVNQGKPYKSLKQAEKERSTGQSSMQFESEISWDFDGVMVRITQSDFDNLDEDMKNDTVNEETVSVDGVHMPVLFVAEVRQMKNKKTETMVQKDGKVKVIDKKDEKKFLDMGYTLAECMELQIEAATPEKIMKDIAALEKMISKIGGNSSAVKMKKVALERKIAKLEAELEDMDEATQESYSNYKKKLKEYGYGPAKKKMKKEAMEKGMPPGEHVFGKEVDGKTVMVHKLEKTGKFCAYVDGDKIGEYDDLASAKKAAMDSLNETYGKMNAKKMTWKDWEREGNDAWQSREKRKDNPYKKKGQARTSWFDGWDNMQMDSDNGDFDESYGKMNASKMSSKEKAKNRALTKADRDAQPKGKVSLKPMPASLAKKMKEDFVKQMNIIVEGGELEQSIEESMSPKQIDMLKKSYESLRGKRISVENGMKLSKTLEKLDKESAIAVAKADIPFMSNLAMNKLLMNFGMSGADIKKAMKESVDEGFMDKMKQLVPGAKGKPAKKLQKKVKKSDNAEQTKIATEINRKLKLVDGLMKKVGPLGGQLGRLMAFRRLPIAKMTPKGMYIALNDWYHSVEDELDYGDDSDALKKKYGRSVEDLYELWEEVGFKLSDYMWASGYDIKGIGQMAKIGFPAKKRTDPEWLKMDESISWEDAATLRAAGVKLDEISGDMKKRYNKAALKDMDKQKNTLKRADDVGSKVVDGAVTDKASPSQTNSRFAKLDKIRQKADKKSANRRKGLATPGKGSTTKVKDYFGMAETKKPVSQMTDKEKADNAAKRKEYKAYQKSKRNEEISGTGYELYHGTLGSAIDTAITHAKLKFGIVISPDERMEVVGMGPRKPSNGKTNTYRLMGNKGKAIQVQVYNRGGSRPYELNMYKE